MRRSLTSVIGFAEAKRCSVRCSALTIPKVERRMQQIYDVPEEFICPLTLQVMTNPVVNRQGNRYEKAALVKWLSLNTACPLTRNPIRLSDFIRDTNLQQKIKQWRTNQGEDPHEIDQECTESSGTMDELEFGLFVHQPPLVIVIAEPDNAVSRQMNTLAPRRWKPRFLRGNRA
jgi:U-box domain